MLLAVGCSCNEGTKRTCDDIFAHTLCHTAFPAMAYINFGMWGNMADIICHVKFEVTQLFIKGFELLKSQVAENRPSPIT